LHCSRFPWDADMAVHLSMPIITKMISKTARRLCVGFGAQDTFVTFGLDSLLTSSASRPRLAHPCILVL
jgi:hypothetical protein